MTGRRSDGTEARGAYEGTGAEALVPVACAVCGAAEARAERIERGFPVVRCAACGFLYVSPRPSQAARACDRPPDAPLGWREVAARRRAEAPRDEALAALVLARVPPLAPWDGHPAQTPGAASLLEVGCGRGFLLARLRERGYAVRGLEQGEAGARFARERLGLDVRQSLLEERPFGDATFDVVLARNEVERAWDPRGHLARARGLLKPGGLLVLRYADRSPLSRLLARIGLARTPVLGAPEVLSGFAPASIERLLRREGFSDVEDATGGVDAPAGAASRALSLAAGRAADLVERASGGRVRVPGLDRCVLARRARG